MENCPLTGRPCSESKTCHLDDIVDGNCTKYVLCNNCAKCYFNNEPLPGPDTKVVEPPTSAFFIKTMVEFLQFITTPKKTEEKERICPQCKSTLEKIKTTGKFGCLKCVEIFNDVVKKPTEELIYSKRQIEPVKVKENLNSYCGRLNLELLEALRLEKFEDAAVIRNKLNAVEFIRTQKEELQVKLDRAVETGSFEEAQEIKQSIQRIIDDFLRFQN